jgi:hypothetical protein
VSSALNAFSSSSLSSFVEIYEAMNAMMACLNLVLEWKLVRLSIIFDFNGAEMVLDWIQLSNSASFADILCLGFLRSIFLIRDFAPSEMFAHSSSQNQDGSN